MKILVYSIVELFRRIFSQTVTKIVSFLVVVVSIRRFSMRSEPNSKCTGKGTSLSWVPTSDNDLAEAEDRLLKDLHLKAQRFKVPIFDGEAYIWTIKFDPPESISTSGVSEENTESPKSNTPIVLIHGFGGGCGMWAGNFEELSRDRTVYAFDLLGFGRSSRVAFPCGAEEAEDKLIQSIEDWRAHLGLKEFILMGHSFGGFLSTAYAIKYPQRIRHLVPVDPWGFPVAPTPEELRERIPARFRIVGSFLKHFNVFAGLRAVGPYGPRLVRKFRPDLAKKFSKVTGDDEDALLNYLYHCNAQTPSGEIAFKRMQSSFIWAARPMIDRIQELDPKVHITVILGENSWMDGSASQRIKEQIRPDSPVDIVKIPEASHHVYADQMELFNQEAGQIAKLADINP